MRLRAIRRLADVQQLEHVDVVSLLAGIAGLTDWAALHLAAGRGFDDRGEAAA